MQPIFLNLTPVVYEAIIASLALGSIVSLFALRRKWQQTETLKSIIKTIVPEATKTILFGAAQVLKANADTRRVLKALTNADARVQELEARVAELEAEDAEAGEETSGLSARFPFRVGPFGNIDPRHPLAERFGGVERRHDPLGELFARLGRSGPDGPKVQAFRVTPTGLEPVRGPEDFLRGGTFNRDVVRPPVPSLASILSVLAGMPAGFGFHGDPRRPDENAKADLTPDSFLRDVRFHVGNPGARVDRPGDAFKYDDRDPTLTTINEAAHGHEPQPAADEAACDTQRAAPEPQKAPQAVPEPSVASADQPQAKEPAARSEPRVPRYTPQGDFNSQSPRAG